MTHPSSNSDIFRWKRFTKNKKPAGKVQLSNGDINHWMKRVELASELAVSEVFSLKKAAPSGLTSHAMPLASTEQLQDHDEAYAEAQALLSDWMNRKLCLEMEGEDDHLCPGERSSPPAAVLLARPTHLDYSNFDDLYSHLTEEEESCAVNSFLQDLMEREVLDSGTVEDLSLDSEREKRRPRDPSITMEARHRQVRENRAQRDALRERQRREKEMKREGREEALRREKEEERRRRQEARRQEELVEQEMVRLRRQMEERRSQEQLARQREKERERRDRKRPDSTLLPQPQSSSAHLAAPQQQNTQSQHGQQQAQARVHILNLKCLQKHFSGWYSVLLERRVRMGKAAALCDWRRQLRTWRAWRALVWAGREQREAEKTQEELRIENRNCQVATESDRRRLLRRCLDDWRLWCRGEGERRELLAQQEETRRKMAALISAAATGKLAMVPAACEPITVRPEPSVQTETSREKCQQGSPTVDPAPSPGRQGDPPAPTQAWQVTRRHAELRPEELRPLQQGGKEEGVANAPRSRSAELRGGRFGHRHANQQRTIQEQRRRLREQQEQIARLQEEKCMLGLQQEVQRAALTSDPSPSDPGVPRSRGVSRDRAGLRSAHKEAPSPALHPSPRPSVTAMEERARLRAERRREVEEMKRKREEERLAQMKAAQEERQKEEEEERQRALERRREERRREREKEQQKQRRLETERQLQVVAQQHYHRTLLLRRGLVPWKRLVSLSRDKGQLAGSHHRHAVLRQCILSWQQVAGESQAQKQASADQLHQHILLRRSLCSWKRLKDQSEILAGRAERFQRTHTLRRVLMLLLDHVTQEKLRGWELQQQADQHSHRRALRSCFQAWRRFPRQQREQRQKEFRRDELRRRVAEVLPDFPYAPLQGPWEPPA